MSLPEHKWTRVNSTYEHELARVYHQIDKRGLLMDERELMLVGSEIQQAIKGELYELSNNWGCFCFVGAGNKPADKTMAALNVNSSPQLLAKLQALGFDLPKTRRKNKDTHEFEMDESTDELTLRKVFADTNDPNIERLLTIKKLNTLLIRYILSRRFNSTFYCNYSVTGAITGRRSSRKHIFGVGGNAQTFPKHYKKGSVLDKFGARFRRSIISRPGKLFFIVDQMSAEDWPVSALAENHHALQELRSGTDRHTNLAGFIFSIPVSSRTKKEWKDSIERYLGKKTRHANNYGMQPTRMSDSLAKEGYAIRPYCPPRGSAYETNCADLLEKVNQYDPSIKGVFHNYIKECVNTTFRLQTPLGRERAFHGLRQNDNNYEIFNEAYSYIPQSTVGDNTGLAALYISDLSESIVHDGHDSLNQEIIDTKEDVLQCYARTRKAFDRNITFSNGIVINIPIEGELGYNFEDTIKIEEFTEAGVLKAYEKLKDTYKPTIVSGEYYSGEEATQGMDTSVS